MDRDLAVFKACADATRLRILFLLAERELCVCDLVAVLQMAQGKVSRHLAALRHAGLVRDRRAGLWIHYSLAPAETPLTRRLRTYLREGDGTAGGDRQRLQELAEAARICCRPRARCLPADGGH
ncbi:MAG: metalloregulator ArsR/SmtB family transcription factor [Gemmatimonadota bacterium]